MPPTPKFNRPNLFGGPANGCIFAIVQWKGFAGALANEYATVVGTVAEVATPFGTGLRTAAGASYVSFNWKTLCPEGASPRSIFAQIYYPDVGNFGAVSFGGAGVRDYTFVGPASPQWWGGINTDWDLGGAGATAGWHTVALTNAGINGGENIVYADGAQQAIGANGAAASSTYDSLYLMTIRGAVASPLGTVMQVVVIWNRVITAAEYLTMHSWALANSLY